MKNENLVLLEGLENLSTETLTERLSDLTRFRIVKLGRFKASFYDGQFYLPLDFLSEGSEVRIEPSSSYSYLRKKDGIVLRSPNLSLEYGLPPNWWHASWWPTKIRLSLSAHGAQAQEGERVCEEEYIDSLLTFTVFIPDPHIHSFSEAYVDREEVPIFIRCTVRTNYYFNPNDPSSEVWHTVNRFLVPYKKWYQTPKEFKLWSEYSPFYFNLIVNELF